VSHGVLDSAAVLAVARAAMTPDTTMPDLLPLLHASGVVPPGGEEAVKSLIRRAGYDGRLPKLKPAKTGPKAGTEWTDERREALHWQHGDNQRHTDEEPSVAELSSRREYRCERLLRKRLAGNISGTLPLNPALLAELARVGCGEAIVMRVAKRLRREGVPIFVWDSVSLTPRALAPRRITAKAA
jgi:hypothetical protein